MGQDKAKALLRKYQTALRYSRRLARVAREQYAQTMARAQGIQGRQGSQGAQLGVKVQSSPKGDAMAQTVAAAVDRQREDAIHMERAQTECGQILHDILDLIGTLPQMEQREVLTARYIEGLKWDKIAQSMGISVQTAYRIHSHALRAVRKKLEQAD